ncbi:MAG: hypothetical protein KatS3mg090_0274 [Patescibacteria group bacterium]|nr:MAG: hypothetical protein KatS3mg090_0274 [Patescibacteria group bacterium]
MNFLINYAITAGIPTTWLEYLLLLPIFALIIVFMHYIIGLRSLGLTTPLILIYAFLELFKNNIQPNLLISLSYALIIILSATLVTTFIYFYLRNSLMHYKTKIALAISLSAIITLMVIYFLQLFISINTTNLSAFTIIALILSIENYCKYILRKGVNYALKLFSLTIVLVIICVGIGINKNFIIYLFTYPVISFIAVIAIMIIGIWKGFRLTEYYRFWELLNKDTSNDNENS